MAQGTQVPLVGIAARENDLNDKQRLFVAHYVVDHESTSSAAKAGYKHPSVMGNRLLSNPNVIKAIREIEAKTLNKIGLTLDHVMEQLYYLVTRKASDFVDEEGAIRNIHDMNDRAQSVIDGIEQDVFINPETGEKHIKTKLRLSAKASGVDMAMKRFGAYMAEKQEVKHSFDWDSLYGESAPDVIEAQVIPNKALEEPKNET